MANITAADIANLQGRRSQIYTELNAMTQTTAGGKIDTNQPGAAQHREHRLSLYEELKWINSELDRMENELNSGGNLGGDIISEGLV
jgi:hypothetical protein